MSIRDRKKFKNEVNRRVIERMLAEGLSPSKISKTLGLSYAHVKQIAGQAEGVQHG